MEMTNLPFSDKKEISKATIERLPLYLRFLQ